MLRFVFFSTVIVGLLGSACATMGGLRNEPLNKGVTRQFDAPLSRTVQVGREAMVGSEIEVKEVERLGEDTWMIMGNKKAGIASYGELVRMVLTGTEEGPTTVRIITKKRMATNVLAEGDWSRSIYDQMELALSTSQSP